MIDMGPWISLMRNKRHPGRFLAARWWEHLDWRMDKNKKIHLGRFMEGANGIHHPNALFDQCAIQIAMQLDVAVTHQMVNPSAVKDFGG